MNRLTADAANSAVFSNRLNAHETIRDATPWRTDTDETIQEESELSGASGWWSRLDPADCSRWFAGRARALGRRRYTLPSHFVHGRQRTEPIDR